MDTDFIQSLKNSLAAGTFVKITLGAYQGDEADFKKITVRPVIIKRENKLSFTYSYKTKDIVKNYGLEEAVLKIADFLQKNFGASTLFTTEYDLSYPSMKKTKATIAEAPPPQHDRSKKRLVETHGKKYLQDLKITDAKGEVFKNAQDKYRQIDKYIEILAGLVKDMPGDKIRRVVDMGSGKGYLTFALYDYLHGTLGHDVRVTGVEYRQDMVDLCNRISRDSGFAGLDFVQGTIDAYDADGTNILIALHACDTATDDAIAKGIAANADLIVVAPCCHKQVRREMESGKGGADLSFLLRFGTLMERQAEMVTDGLRALILEYFGYHVNLFEFVSDAHTPKNVMIVARRNPKAQAGSDSAAQKISAAKKYFGISRHALEDRTGL